FRVCAIKPKPSVAQGLLLVAQGLLLKGATGQNSSSLTDTVLQRGQSMMPTEAKPLCVFLSGDVMTGRGIDQVLPHPGNPLLHEPYVQDALEYVQLAESVHGPIPRPVDFEYLWGDALAELHRAGTDLRIINLETSITASEDYWPDKEVLYRMH